MLLYSRLTQLPLRIKQDASLDASGDYKDQMAVFNVLGQRGMLRVFQSAINPKFHLAIDNAKVMGHVSFFKDRDLIYVIIKIFYKLGEYISLYVCSTM